MKFYKIHNIAVVTAPINGVVLETVLKGFLKILIPLSKKIFVITGEVSEDLGGEGEIIAVIPPKESSNRLIRACSYFLIQFSIAKNIFKIHEKVDKIIFFIGSRTYFLPMLLSKFLNLTVITIAAGSVTQQSKHYYKNDSKFVRKFFPVLKRWMENLSYYISDHLIVNTENTMNLLNISRFENKIHFLSDQFIDTNLLKHEKEFNDRHYDAGYMGRLNEEKGVWNFVNCFQLLLSNNSELKFFVGGGGLLEKELKEYVKQNNCTTNVTFSGWYTRSQITEYMNNIKLLVIPSYTEGGPYIALEAMACGTPVLCTRVGFLPDLIIDGENGFFMEDNSPACIAMNFERILNYRNIINVVENAKKTVSIYSRNNIIKSYSNFFEKI